MNARARRPARFSQCAKILRALEMGGWWTTRELYEHVGGCVLHSRVAELRKRGFLIEHEYVPGKSGSEGSKYRLAPSSSPAGAEPTPLSPAPAPLSATEPGDVLGTDEPDVAVTSDPVASVAEQLPLYREPRRGAYSEEAA